MAIEFEFDRTSQRYRYIDSGKFLSKEAMENLTRKAIGQVEKDLDTITQLLINQKINIITWEQQTQNSLRKLHTWQYLLGIGGEKNFTPSDRGTLNNRLKQEWQYLRKFAKQIDNDRLSPDQIKHRINLYINNTDNTHELAIYKGHIRAGYKWERRKRTKNESCGECIFYENLGWRTIGNLPNPGSQCSCKANCGCYKEYSKAEYIPQDTPIMASPLLEGFRWGWIKDAPNARPINQNSTIQLLRPPIFFAK